MKVIVGLGNPGKEYNDTRHNIGFRIVDYINKERGGSFKLDQKLKSEISEVKINGVKALLVKPQIFVNKSGEAIKKLTASFPPTADQPKTGKFKVKDLIVVHDDLDIPFGKVKVSFGRGSAGHKGVQSIIGEFKSEKFYRIRIGTFNGQVVKIKKIKDKRKKVKGINDFVVGQFSLSEKPKLNKAIKDAVQKVVLIISDRL